MMVRQELGPGWVSMATPTLSSIFEVTKTIKQEAVTMMEGSDVPSRLSRN